MYIHFLPCVCVWIGSCLNHKDIFFKHIFTAEWPFLFILGSPNGPAPFSVLFHLAPTPFIHVTWLNIFSYGNGLIKEVIRYSFPKTLLCYFHYQHSLEYNIQFSSANGFIHSPQYKWHQFVLFVIYFIHKETYPFISLHVFINLTSYDQTIFIQIYYIFPFFLFPWQLIHFSFFHVIHQFTHFIYYSRRKYL